MLWWKSKMAAKYFSLLLAFVCLHICPSQNVSPTFFARFDGSFRDLTGNVPEPAVTGEAGFAVGPYGDENSALNLDGVDDVVTFDIPSNVTLFEQDHTIMMWVRAAGSIGCIFCFTDGSDIRSEIWHYNEEDELYVRYRLNDNTNYAKSDLTGVFLLEKWVLLSVTYESSTGFHRVYVNGAEYLRWTESYSSNFWIGSLLRMGRRRLNEEVFEGRLACVQVYNEAFSQREMSQAETLCKPAYTALNPWPQPLGMWAFDSEYKLYDLSKRSNMHHGTITGTTYYDIGPEFQPLSSSEFRNEEPTFFDLNNADEGLSPPNSITFSAWVYLGNGADFPLFQYEYGTETSGTQNWALHIWILSRQLYVCLGNCLRTDLQGSVGQWNHYALSFDFYRAKVHFYVNGEKTTHDTTQTSKLKTAQASGLRIGKTFYAPDERYSNFRLACVQLYDTNLLDHEIMGLQHSCYNVHKTQKGIPEDLTLVYDFNGQSKCRSTSPSDHKMTHSFGQPVQCDIKAGHRMREGESVAVNESGPVYLTERALLEADSPFTMMFFIRLEYDTTASVGFEGGPKVTFTSFEAGFVNLTLSFGSAVDETTLSEFHNLNYTHWFHIVLACGELGDCYLFRNSTFIGNVYLKPSVIKNTHQKIVIESNESEVRLSCFQLYRRRLSQPEIETSSARCYKKAIPSQHPVPVGLWPLDSKYRGTEATRRNNGIEFEYFEGCLWDDDTPLSDFSRGSLLINGSAANATRCLGHIESNAALDVRHSFTWLAYVMPMAGEPIVPLFSYDGPSWGMPIYLVDLHGNAPKLHCRAFDFWTKDGLTSSAKKAAIEFDKWQMIAFQCDYATGLCHQWVDYEARNEHIMMPAELSTNNQVIIGNTGNDRWGKAKMTCMQLYDAALSADQMRSAMQLCNYEKNVGSSYTKPIDIPPGFTRVNMTENFTGQTQLQCLTACSSSSYCFSMNYFSTTKTCQLSAELYNRKTGLSAFEETNGVYLEFVHPIVAEGY